MGGIVQPSTTIGGVLSAPGIPLASSPYTGFYQLTNGLGFGISGTNFEQLNATHATLGPIISPGVPTAVGTAGSPYGLGGSHQNLVITPDGLHVYRNNNATSQIGAFSRNLVTGVLTEIVGSPYASGLNAVGIASSPDGRHIMAAGFNGVYCYTRNSSTGALTPVAGSPFGGAWTGGSPFDCACSPNGLFVVAPALAPDNKIKSYLRNVNTGVLTLAGTYAVGTDPYGVTISPDNLFVFVTNRTSATISVFSINQITGALTPIAGSPFAVAAQPYHCKCSPDGKHLIVSHAVGSIVSVYSISATGSLSQIAGSPFAAGVTCEGLTISADGLYVAAANFSSNTMSMYSRNTVTGALSIVAGSPFAIPGGPTDVAWASDFRHIYAVNNTGVYGFTTATIPTYPLLDAIFDPLGGLAGVFNVYGVLNVSGGVQAGGLPLATYPTMTGNGGKFLKTTGSVAAWEYISQNIPVAMVANAGAFTIDDSGAYVIDVTGVLGAAGALTVTLTNPTAPVHATFHNNTTGGFPLVLNATWTIPPGTSEWYWNGANFHLEGVEPFRTANVTPLPAAGAVITLNHLCGIVPVHTVFELVCLTAEFGYAIGDAVQCTTEINVVVQSFTPWASVTQVGFTLAAGYVLSITDKATGAIVTPTAANWAYRFMVQA